jgi:hypothetical protein
MLSPAPIPPAASLLRLDNLLVGVLALVALGWASDFLGCRFGYRLGVLTWLYATLEPLGLALSVFCALAGLVLVAFRKNGLAWLLSGAALFVLPRLFEHYAPASCAVG